jgi:hypothetical protein
VDVPLSTSTALATRDQLFSTNEQLALAGFLGGYSDLTREAYTLDLRQYVAWCTEHRVAVFSARRRLMTERCPVTGKATCSTAEAPVSSPRWWSGTAGS